MKVEPNNEDLFNEYSNEVIGVEKYFNNKKKFINYFKEHLNIKENVENIKFYSRSNLIFDTKEYFNKNDKPVDSE